MPRKLNIVSHNTAEELDALAKREKTARVRDRIRLIAAAMRCGSLTEAAAMLGFGQRAAWNWLKRYNEDGVQALADKPKSGRPKLVAGPDAAHLAARIEAGPTEADGGISRLRGTDVRRIASEELGVEMALSTAFLTLHRLGYTLQKPTPRHEKNDPAAMEQWKAEAPLLSRRSPASAPAKPSKSGSRTKRGSARKGR